MKSLGLLDPFQLKENELYKALFPPLTDAVRQDLTDSIQRVGVLAPLIVARMGADYEVLAGYNRLDIARNMGIKVPCDLAESCQEIADAIFDNAYRRQLSEEERSAIMGKKSQYVNDIVRKTTAPEVYELYTEGKLDDTALNMLSHYPIVAQKQLLDSLAIERAEPADDTALKEKEGEFERQKQQLRDHFETLLKRKEDEAASATRRIQKEKDELDKKLAGLKEELNKTTSDLKTLKESQTELIRLKRKYTSEREEVMLEVRKELEVTGQEAEQTRLKQSQAIKDKDTRINELAEQIESLRHTIEGKEAMVGAFQQSVARMDEQHRAALRVFANPNTILDPVDMVRAFLARTLVMAKTMQLLPEGVATVKEALNDIGDLTGKIMKACETNILVRATPEEQIKAIEARAEQGSRPYLRAVSKGDEV